MFALVRWCVEPISKRCRLKVKVTIEGHPSLSCSLHISWTLWKIFMNDQMFVLVRRCAESITQACRLKVKVTVKGHVFQPWISCSLYISWTLWKMFIKFRKKVRLRPLHCHSAAGDIAVLQTALFVLLSIVVVEGWTGFFAFCWSVSSMLSVMVWLFFLLMSNGSRYSVCLTISGQILRYFSTASVLWYQCNFLNALRYSSNISLSKITGNYLDKT